MSCELVPLGLQFQQARDGLWLAEENGVVHDSIAITASRDRDLRSATLVFSDQDLLAAVHEVGLPLLQGRDWVTAIVVHRPAQLQLASRCQGIAASIGHDSIFSQVDEASRRLLKQVR